MTLDQSYFRAREIIEAAQRSGAKELNLSWVHPKVLPESLGQLTQLQSLNLSGCNLTVLPESLGQLTQLQSLNLSACNLTVLPESLGQLTQLQSLNLSACNLTVLPQWLGGLTHLRWLDLGNNQLSDLLSSLAQIWHLEELNLDNNPLNPELAAAYKQGLEAVKVYLRAKAAAQITLNEAKLILIGEGEVGKSCLLGALRDDPWEEGRPTTHGIEIKPAKVTDPDSGREITLNGWDFGGQRVYRPTHQLFFSVPAVYLVVWKPREGPQQDLVKEWIKLVKHREPDAKILVVATHGGPQQRQPDIDRQELWDLFGKDTVLDFFHVESKPDKKGKRRGVEELKRAVARVASALPEMGRSVPKHWQEVREAFAQNGVAYLPLERVLQLCRAHQMDDEEARLFVTIEHRLGHLIHYQHDPALRDIVVLKPDWLATAISFVLDDEQTRKNHGLVPFARLSKLWDDPTRPAEFRYAPDLHPLFVRLMERFDLSYKVALPTEAPDAIGFWQQVKGILSKATKGSDELTNLHYTSLIAQLVPYTRPERDLERVWPLTMPVTGDSQQVQICRIVDEKGHSATAEGLFYQLIVRLHKYSLGRVDYEKSIHWQRGLVLDDDYNGRALMEHIGNDVRITVRAPYPERFLSVLTSEVKYLVESFWKGMRCDVMVPCINPCSKNAPGTGLYEVQKLIESKRCGHPEYPCPVCNEWQNIDCLLRNAPAARAVPIDELLASTPILDEVRQVRQLLLAHHTRTIDRFDLLDVRNRETLSKIDASFTRLMQALTDEAKEGPRLFSLVPVDRTFFNPKQWASAKFHLTLWCEHSRLPLPALNGKDSEKGVYEIELTREWFKKAAPFLKVVTGTLSLVLPIASSGIKLALDDTAYKAIEEQLDFGKSVIDATLEGGTKASEWMGADDTTKLEHGGAIRAQGATLRELHALLKAKDPGFGGLVRVMNKRQEFLWVHPQFAVEY
jgi:internalin A